MSEERWSVGVCLRGWSVGVCEGWSVGVCLKRGGV